MAVVSCPRRLFEGVEALASRSAEQLLHEFRSNATADVTMSLLRSSDALLHLALMAAHLGEGQIVDGQSLAADMNADLPALLRSVTPSREQDAAEAPTLDAEHLLTKWTKR